LSQAGKTATPVRKGITPVTDETAEMEETSNYRQGAVMGANPGVINVVNVKELVMVPILRFED
jgi:hypothetical protein